VHASVSTTEIYIRDAWSLRAGFGEVSLSTTES
jgi:hypothetical protein